jgi:hypothetical protein
MRAHQSPAHPGECRDPDRKAQLMGTLATNVTPYDLGPGIRRDERWKGMVMTLALSAVPAITQAAPLDLASLELGQTLACTSKNPAKQLYVVVGRIEPLGGRAAVSVSLYDKAPGSPLPQMAHLPIDLEALAATCAPTTRESLLISPLFEGGYADWRKALEVHKAGVFTISIDDIDDLIRKQVAKAAAANAAKPTATQPPEPK